MRYAGLLCWARLSGRDAWPARHRSCGRGLLVVGSSCDWRVPADVRNLRQLYAPARASGCGVHIIAESLARLGFVRMAGQPNAPTR